jgi:hypothetical protein
MRRSHEVYGFVTDVSELAHEGWYGNPWWATTDEAATFSELTADEVVRRVQAARSARDATIVLPAHQ